MIRTANPALNASVFQGLPSADRDQVMTLDGTVNKSLLSIAITMLAAWWTWVHPEMISLVLPALLVSVIVVLALMFKKQWAPALTPIYAVAEGVMLGMISLWANTKFPGIAFQAVSLTFGVFAALLFAYKSGTIKATENFKLGVVAATGGIAVMYLCVMLANLFGYPTPFMHSSSPLSIGISVVVVIVAALNLVLDFDFIETASNSGNAPKYMEWYAAFGLLVTLVWLYVEILHLLMKLNERK